MQKVFLLFTVFFAFGTFSTFAQTANADSLLQVTPSQKTEILVEKYIPFVNLKSLPDSVKRYVKILNRKALKKAQVKQSMVKVDDFNQAISAYQTLANLLKPTIFTINADIVQALSKIKRPQVITNLNDFLLTNTVEGLKYGPYYRYIQDADFSPIPVNITIAEAVSGLAKIKLSQTVADLNQFILSAIADTLKFGPYQNTGIKTDRVEPLAALNAPMIFSIPNKAPAMALASNDKLSVGVYLKMANTNDVPLVLSPVTNAELQACLTSKIVTKFDEVKDHFTAVASDTMRAVIPPKMPLSVTTLDKQIALLTNDSLRAAYYQKIANYYLKYDSISIRKTKQYYQEQALVYIMKALHSYSKAGDNNGLRTSYNNLAKVYKDRREYPQAKWFILQSNTISRELNDAPNIISSLVELASIKMAIKDYGLAKGDLNEALSLSSANHFPKQESLVQASYATLYAETNEPKKSAAALKRHDAIEDSINKADAARRLAALKAQDSTEMAKKKLLTSAGKKVSKPGSARKIVSL